MSRSCSSEEKEIEFESGMLPVTMYLENTLFSKWPTKIDIFQVSK